MVQLPLAFSILLGEEPNFWANKVLTTSTKSYTLMLISSGYFMHDFIHSAVNVKIEGCAVGWPPRGQQRWVHGQRMRAPAHICARACAPTQQCWY